MKLDIMGHNYGEMVPYNMLERWKEMLLYCAIRRLACILLKGVMVMGTGYDGKIDSTWFADKAMVLCGFPAVGKTVYSKVMGVKGVVIDSDSSKFSWRYDSNGDKIGRHPDFPSNYLNYIKANLNDANTILTSSHGVVRQALRDAGIPFVIIAPRRDAKDAWIARCVDRGNTGEFVYNLSKNWDTWIDEIEADEKDGIPVVWLYSNEYLSYMSVSLRLTTALLNSMILKAKEGDWK